MIFTRSAFFYGYEATFDAQFIDFNEGADDLVATVAVGSYSISELCTQITSAMNAVGTFTYACTIDRSTRIITIGGSSAFDLLNATGTNTAKNILLQVGFAATDYSSVTSVAGTSAAVAEYLPQRRLQDYIPTENWTDLVDATVNKAANGNTQVQSFGKFYFMQCNITLATNIVQGDGSDIESSPVGVDQLTAFMGHITDKNKIEFMPDRDDLDTFQKLLCEKTTGSTDGIGFKLREKWDVGAAGYYDSGIILFKLFS